jgi:hypothetical protein
VCTTFLDAVPDGLVTGLYVRGGLSFGEWVEGHSDIDFTATLRRRPTDEDLTALRTAHETVASSHGDAPYFDGVHVLVSDLAAPPEDCPDRPTVHLGTFSDAGRFDLHPVSWHELARHGVTVTGPPADSLDIWTDDAVLRQVTIDNLDTYWRGQAESCVADPHRASMPFACEWVVPGVARLHHLLVTGEQTGKSLAPGGRWRTIRTGSTACCASRCTFATGPSNRNTRTSSREAATSPRSRRTSWRRAWFRDGASAPPQPPEYASRSSSTTGGAPRGPAQPPTWVGVSSPTGTSVSSRLPSGAKGQAQFGS